MLRTPGTLAKDPPPETRFVAKSVRNAYECAGSADYRHGCW